MKKRRKISDIEFLNILRENGGLFARTAKAIQAKFAIKYSRQAVRDRAKKFRDELNDIEEENLDVAEEGLHILMICSDSRVRLKAIEFYLKNKGKKRGYGDFEEAINKQIGEVERKLKAMSDEELDAELKKAGYYKVK